MLWIFPLDRLPVVTVNISSLWALSDKHDDVVADVK